MASPPSTNRPKARGPVASVESAVPPAPPTGLADALVQASFLTMAVLNRVAAQHELSLTQLRVLAILQDRRPKMAELAEHLGLDKSTMTGLVDRAEKRGLVERVPNQTDGRAVDVRLTRAGAALAKRLAAQVTLALAPVTGTLAPADQRRLQTLLENLLAR